MAHVIDDSEWAEVRMINSYALFMGYLSMAVRGLGYLVLGWTTVVLLGGFVSLLGKKDFWCLTMITLVQTAGVFDVFLNEKLRYIGKSFFGFAGTVYAMVIRKNTGNNDEPSMPRLLLGFVVLFVQLLVFAVILCPLAALYVFGLLITTGISLWRLIQHDYGKGDGDANLQPALNVLYSLALFQGVLFCYKFVSSFAGKGLASDVAENYKLVLSSETRIDRGLLARKSVEDYLRETMIGCEKDPSFAKGRNLVTYAVGLMKSDESSASSFHSGAWILDKLLKRPQLSGQHLLIRQLIVSTSSSQVLQKLLQALDSRSSDDRDIREPAARIVAHLAGEIRLKQFPQGIQRISSLLETTSEQQDDDSAPSAHYKELMVQSLLILKKLAADEHNRRVISNAQGLLSKAMASVSFDLLHRIDHEAWSSIVAASLKLMCRLVTAPGETGTKLRRQILSNKEAIKSMEGILGCDNCGEQLCILAIKILTQLPEDASPSMSTASREKFTKLLVGIFTDNNKDRSIRKLAGEALAMLSDQSESNATIILKVNDTVVDDLRKMLLDVKSSTYRISAAEILEHLYIRYTQDDDLKELEEAMKNVMPKVLREILLCGSTGKGKQTEKKEKQADEINFSAPNTDIEGQDGGVSQDNDRNNNTSSCQHVDRKLQAALLSLSAAIFDKLISEGEDLAQLVRKIAPEGPSFSFASKLKEMVERNNKPTANCLRIMKITCRMIISMIKHNASYDKEDLERLMQSLSDASKNMLDLEGFMIFSSSDRGALKPVSTLASLVKEAQKRLERKKQEQMASTSAS